MPKVTVTLSEEYYKKLRDIANRLGITPDTLLTIGIENMLSRPSEEFSEAIEYVLTKNSELYRRLA